MSFADVSKKGGGTAAEVCAHIQLGKSSRELLRDDYSPEDFAALLLEQKQYADAVKLVAYMLPVREAVWWACQCARQVFSEDTSAAELEAIFVAEKWVAEGDDATRRAALPVGDAAGVATAAGSVAVAVFFSGDSLALPDDAPVYPAENSAARIIVGSVLSAANTFEPAETSENFRTFICQGIELYRAMFGQEAS